MDKQEYITRRTQIFEAIFGLEKQLTQLKEEYIKSSPLSEFSIGERVMIRRPERTVNYIDGSYTQPEEKVYAYIHSFYLDLNSDVKVELLQETKKGKPSKKKEVYCPHWGDLIFKIE